MSQYSFAIRARFILSSLMFWEKRATRLFTVLLVSFTFSATASAQVFESGPSRSSLFAFVFDSVGDGVAGDGSGLQFNVSSEGSLGDSFEADFGTEVNIRDGLVGDNFQAKVGSEVNIIGGTVGDDFSLNRDRALCVLPCPAWVNISGGTVVLNDGDIDALDAAATDALRLELAPFGIRLSLVIPGFVDTAVFDNAREGAMHLREDLSNPYRQTMFDLDDLANKNLKNSLSPDDVARVIVRAATARRPKERYYTPLSTLFQTGFLALLPSRWLDALLGRVYGIKVG